MNILAAFGFNDLLLPDHVGRKRKVLRSGCGRGWLFALFPGRLFDRLNGGAGPRGGRGVSFFLGGPGGGGFFFGCFFFLSPPRGGGWVSGLLFFGVLSFAWWVVCV